MFWRWESVSATEVRNAQFEHIEDVAIENAPNHQVIWALLLVATHCEETAVVLHRLVLN